MGSLSSVLSMALASLANAQGALTVVADNISNVNTPGYARRRADIVEALPVTEHGVTYGRGAELTTIEALRDETLELRMHAEAQKDGAANAQLSALQPLDALFSDIDNGLSGKLSDYFDALTQLQTDPANLPLRQSVLTAAGNVASGFNTDAQNLERMRANLDYDVVESVSSINTLCAEIARLNVELSRAHAGGGNAPALEDQRIQAVRQISGFADVAVITSDDGVTLTTSSGTPLVVGASAYALSTQAGADAHLRVFSGDNDVTAQFRGGSLGAQIDSRDNVIASIAAELDRIAAAFAQATNGAQANGFDLNGNAGQDLYTATAAAPAATLAVATVDPKCIAASDNGDAGSNGNLGAIAGVSTLPLVDGRSILDSIGALTFRIGSMVSDAQARVDGGELIMKQLATQRGAISGVSLDEEATDLIRYQRAYQAAARVIETVDQLLALACNLGKD